MAKSRPSTGISVPLCEKRPAEQRLARRLVAGDRVLGHGDQLAAASGRAAAAGAAASSRRSGGGGRLRRSNRDRPRSSPARISLLPGSISLVARLVLHPLEQAHPLQAPDIVGIGRRARRGRSRCRRRARRRRRRSPAGNCPGRCRRRPRGRSPCRCASIRLRIASILRSWPSMKLWPPKPGIDAHHQDEVELLEHIIERLGRRRRIERRRRRACRAP